MHICILLKPYQSKIGIIIYFCRFIFLLTTSFFGWFVVVCPVASYVWKMDSSVSHWSDDYQVSLTRQSSSCIAVVDEVSKSCVRFIWLGSIGYPSVLVWVHILNLCVHSNSMCIHILSLCVHNLTLCSFLKNLYFCPYFHGFFSIIDEETRDWRVLFAIKRTICVIIAISVNEFLLLKL